MGRANVTKDEKQCAVCGELKPVSAYTKRSGRNGRRGTCRLCLRRRHKRTEEFITPARTESLAAVPPSTITVLTEPNVAGENEGMVSVPIPSGPPKTKRNRRRRRKRKVLSGAAAATEAVAVVDSNEEVLLQPQTDSPVPDNSGKPHEKTAELSSAETSNPPRKRRRGRRRRKQGKVQIAGVASSSKIEQLSEVTAVVAPPEGEELGASNTAEQSPQSKTEQEGVPAASRKRKRPRRRKRRLRESLLPHEDERPPVRPAYKRIVPIKGPFTYDPRVLNDKGTGLIRLRGKRETGKRWSTEIPYEMAVRMVSEGAAGILHPRLIHKLYTKTDFRLFVLQRDNYVCNYCGRFGDTIDHVMPKSKGGLSTPANCVCACAECNLKKADHLDFVFDDL